MTKTGIVLVAMLSALVVGEYAWTTSLRNDIAGLTATTHRLKDSLQVLRGSVDSLRDRVPGLGEYMSTIQLHVAKLWFAAGADNWSLAGYELDELQETIAGAEELHAIRNGVSVAAVLKSVTSTQIQPVRQSVAHHDLRAFRNAYTQTLDACNSCHKAAGYGFIHVTIPAHEPVTNQQWSPVR